MKIFRYLLPVILLFILSACSGHFEDEIVVVTTPDNPPYSFIENGQIVGLDIDIINAIAYHLGKKAVIKTVGFHKLFGEVATKRVDMAIAGLSITPERLLRVDFSDTYTSATVAVLFKKDSHITQEKELRNKMIGATLGTVLGQVAQDLAIRLDARVRTVRDNNILVKELASGIVDVAILEEAQAQAFSNLYPHLSYFLLKDLSSDFAIALPKNSPLKVSIDNAFRVLEAEGIIDNIREKWIPGISKKKLGDTPF